MAKSNIFAPVVAVLGHVDHGKTTLLDAIRKTSLAQKEHGGITQKIGAYQIEIPQEAKGDFAVRKITFIDTPGHEAFLKMRSRGAVASDMALLVVASDDGVMPQTVESIKHIKDAGIPFMVVLTKADLKTADPHKVKQQLVKAGVAVEGLGGDTPILSVSAKEGRGIKELLEMIMLVSELHGILKNDSSPFKGVVIESRLDRNTGPLVSLIVQEGKISVGDLLFYELGSAKVRALISYDQKRLLVAWPGDPVEVLGFSEIVPVGTIISAEGLGPSVAPEQGKTEVAPPAIRTSFAPEKKTLPMILKADTDGSLEALIHSLPVGIEIIEKGTGIITEGDVLLAKSTKAIIVGFNTKAIPQVVKLAQLEGVIIKVYTIIYELLEEIEEVVKSVLLAGGEKILGKGEIIASFPYQDGQVLGIKVMDGYMTKGAKVKLLRKGEKIGTATIISLRQGKINRNRVDKNQECGIITTPSLDFSLGDMLLSYSS